MVAGASDDHSAAKVWALIGGIASVLSILGWLGLNNVGELKDLVADSPPSSSSPAPYTSSPSDRIPDDSDTGEGNADEPDPEPSTPTPDPTEEAFEAISAGDCLAVYDTGRGGTTSVEWSVGAPPDPVSCAGEQAQVQVSAINTACPPAMGSRTGATGPPPPATPRSSASPASTTPTTAFSAGSPATRSPSP
jgi:hypothetical protein